MFDVVMILGCPPLVGRREALANTAPLSEGDARELLRHLGECVGTSGVGRDSLTLLGVELRERR